MDFLIRSSFLVTFSGDSEVDNLKVLTWSEKVLRNLGKVKEILRKF